ncbi:hypothetical protein ABW19_dt0206363 [Dactylella cylindrospora]|nr:hypothetical protein ABW19_dt0206363 [Dactylella cylindrospora]
MKPAQSQGTSGGNNLMLNVLTLGTYAAYSAWNRSREDSEMAKATTSDPANLEPNPAEASGRFIIGYTGDLEDEDDDDDQATKDPTAEQKGFISTTIWIRRQPEAKDTAPEDTEQSDISPAMEECRLVAYAVGYFTVPTQLA